MAIKTVVEVMKPVYNEKEQQLDVDGEVWDESSEKEPQMEPQTFYLLHFGLQPNFVYDKDGKVIPYSETMGICQHMESGHIQLIHPTQLRVLGVAEIQKRGLV
jgi:dethiobiotin synthetase